LKIVSEQEKISIADTARWVAFYRAMETERPDALFKDPYARALAGPRGEDIALHAAGGRSTAIPMIVRTAVMDELIASCVRDEGVDLVINLAAGLDARPYRMDLPASLQWVEVDYPATIAYKTPILAAGTPRCRLERIGADLADVDARRRLFAALGQRGTRALVVTEGLMTYLTEVQAGNFATDLAAQLTFHYWLTDIVAPYILRMMRGRMSRNLDPASAVFQLAPAEGAGFYAPFGWRLVSYRAMTVEMQRLHREPPSMWFWRLMFWKAMREDATRRTGPMTGTILMERTAA
jgi:methyltransferase (TIGR00027 family)